VGSLWAPGMELPRLRRSMTAERMRWYSDALETLSWTGAPPEALILAGPNVHTDDDIARDNGLRARVADGMVSTNWISTVLTDAFAELYLEGGSLRTRYLRPIFEDDNIEVVLRVTGRQGDQGHGDRLTLDVSCVKDDGEVATAGTATVRVA
jgi:3-hydroxybutyryl-CoA dehydratase